MAICIQIAVETGARYKMCDDSQVSGKNFSVGHSFFSTCETRSHCSVYRNPVDKSLLLDTREYQKSAQQTSHQEDKKLDNNNNNLSVKCVTFAHIFAAAAISNEKHTHNFAHLFRSSRFISRLSTHLLSFVSRIFQEPNYQKASGQEKLSLV